VRQPMLPRVSRWLRGSICVLTFATTAVAQPSEIVVSRTYARATGAPVSLSDSFPACDPNGRFSLVVDNGPGGEPRVSSGSVSINGIEVVREIDLNQNVSHLERPLTNVTASNTLTVHLGSQPRGTITVSIVAVQSCGIRITSPTSESIISSPEVLVQGTIDARLGSDIGVTVNGVIAAVEGGTFAAPLRVTPQLTRVIATAVDGHGTMLASATVDVTVPAVMPDAAVRVRALPALGGVPLTVQFFVASRVPYSEVAVDLRGTGAIDFRAPRLDDQTFTYQQPGLYLPRLTITEPNGTTHAADAVVQVYDSPVLDALLQAKWLTFKDALRRGDIAEAVHHITTRARARYEADLSTLAQDLAAIDTILGAIRLVKFRGAEAVYEMRRVDEGVTKSFEVRFRLDVDGVWRLHAF
jgi:hypothetical protein